MRSKYFSYLNKLNKRSDDKAKSEDPSAEELELKAIRESGLFDRDWYLKSNEDLKNLKEEALVHFYFHGWKEGRWPCYLFDPNYYLNQYPDVAAANVNPLYHYIQWGEREGRSPSVLFDAAFYANQLDDVPAPANLLGDYLIRGNKQGKSPNPHFDAAYYLEHNPDIQQANIDPFEHFLFQGYREERNPSARFDLAHYRASHMQGSEEGANPLLHYIEFGIKANLSTSQEAPASNGNLYGELQRNHRTNEGFELPKGMELDPSQKLAKVVALYLPQFHPIPENDEWWGKGFTEWRNVTRGLPRFKGHIQPKLPRDLGYYDLRREEVMREQIELARQSGLFGFCFYYYSFNNKRLLELPLNNYIALKGNDFPFCIMWANENWTRTWDGMEQNVLIKQDYDDKDDEQFVADIVELFACENYIRIGGQPLFFIYRPGIIPDAKAKIERWRTLFEKAGEQPLIFMVQGFGDNDPEVFGLDGAIEFPPHKLVNKMSHINNELEVIDSDFAGHYFSYDDLVNASRSEQNPEHPLIRTVLPDWDNEARRPGRGMGFVGSTPSKFGQWLSDMIHFARKNPVNGESFVFVNAWNEWAEGAYLEPDTHWGSAYLNAARKAISGAVRSESKLRLIYVGHDAHRHGAQLLTLNIVKTLVQTFGIEVQLILLEGGPLVQEYQEVCPVYVIDHQPSKLNEKLTELKANNNISLAICNTVVTGAVSQVLHDHNIRMVHLIHELKTLITERNLESSAQAIQACADHVVFASSFVKDSFEQVVGKLGEKSLIRPQGIYQKIEPTEGAHGELREKLGIPESSKVVLNLGYGDLRKGFDLFVNLAKTMVAKDSDYHFVWLGSIEESLLLWLNIDLGDALMRSNFHIIPFQKNVSLYLEGSDVLALTSREDPFPSVVLEALGFGTPVVGFKSGGGYEDVLKDPLNGSLVEMSDVNGMAEAIRQLVAQPNNEKVIEERIANATSTYDWNNYVFGLLELLDPGLKRVSVVVPNYNYEHHIAERLKSIFMQDYPVYEVIVLDDKSKDNSLHVIEHTAQEFNRSIRLIANDTNSGNVFKQWKKGCDEARGEFLWIAEADDLAEKGFLSQLASEMDEETVLGFTDSRQIDENSKLLGASYHFYYETVDANQFSQDFHMSGEAFAAQFLSVKNLILNASAVLFRKGALQTSMAELQEKLFTYRVCGDWLIYCDLLVTPGAKVFYKNVPLNSHRRHQESVTHSNLSEVQLEEITSVHNLLSDKTQLKDKIKESQAAYIYELKNQFAAIKNDN